MKKIITTIVVTAITLMGMSELRAQDTRFGIKGGVTYYQLNYNYGIGEESSDPSIGFSGGLFAEFAISDMFSIQPEVLYIQKNGEDSDDFFGETETTKTKLSYVDVPVLLKLNIPLDGGVSPFIAAGPYAGYLIDAVAEYDGETEDMSEFLNDINYGIAFAAGAKFGAVSIEARYDLGMANIYNMDDFDDVFDSSDFDVKLSGLSLFLGISF